MKVEEGAIYIYIIYMFMIFYGLYMIIISILTLFGNMQDIDRHVVKSF